MRVESIGIYTPAGLFTGMVNSGIPSQIASELYYHEKAHADADTEKKGEFGFYFTSGWIIAFYLIKGERTPEQLMEIASAPGFSRMSSQDWNIYNQAWKDYIKEVKEKNFGREEDEQIKNDENMSNDDLRGLLIDVLSKKLDRYSENNDFPKLNDLLRYEFKDLIFKYGKVIYEIYNEAIKEVKEKMLNIKNSDEKITNIEI